MAAKIYNVTEAEITKAQRQLGKAAILGLVTGWAIKLFTGPVRRGAWRSRRS